MKKQKEWVLAAALASGALLGSNVAVADEACGIGITLNPGESQALFFTNTDDDDDAITVTALCGPLGAIPTMATAAGPVIVPNGATVQLSSDLSVEACVAGPNLGVLIVEDLSGAEGPEVGILSVQVTDAGGTTLAYATENCDD